MQASSLPAHGIFTPTWSRGLFALAHAIAGFLLPQEVPLEWYPLNEPGTDINYLEITCAATITNETQIFLDFGRGFNQLDSIRIPISPSQQAYTYTFPLQDAPLIGLRIDPYSAPGELLMTNLRIINRRGEEIRHFTREDFAPTHEIAKFEPTPTGWKIVTTPNATDPYSHISMPAPIIPKGMDHRNLLRCLLSTGYLAGMLLILLLAVLFTFYRPSGWRDFLIHLGFMATLAAMFSAVGNRGLIRNSVHYARFIPPKIETRVDLEIALNARIPASAQLFFDTGDGFNEADSVRQSYAAHAGIETVRFPLPDKPLHALRFDPSDGAGQIDIVAFQVVDAGRRTLAVLPLASLQPGNGVVATSSKQGREHLNVAFGANDPVTFFSDVAVSAINRAQTSLKQAAPRN